MAHILLTTLGSYGDLHPMLSLGIGLKECGHKVTLATTDYYRNNVLQAGLTFHPIRPHFTDDPTVAKRLMDPQWGPQYLMQQLLMPALTDMFDDLRPAVHQCDALITTTLVFAAPLLAKMYQKPWASATFQPMTLMSENDPPILPNVPYWSNHLMQQSPGAFKVMRELGQLWTNTWFKRFYNLREQLGIAPYGNPAFDGQFSPHLNLALFPDIMGQPQPDWPDNTVQPGYISHSTLSLPDEQLSDELQAFIRQGPPPIVATLGTAAVRAPGNVLDTLIHGLAQHGKPAIVLVGKQYPKPYPSIAPNVFIAPYAPYHELFPQSELIIHSCGMGTLCQALLAGKPQLMIPFAFDQPDNAHRLKQLGVGKIIPKDRLTPKRLQRILNQYNQHPSYAHRAQQCQGNIVSPTFALSRAIEAIQHHLLQPKVTQPCP